LKVASETKNEKKLKEECTYNSKRWL